MNTPTAVEEKIWEKPTVLFREEIMNGFVSIEKDKNGTYIRISKMVGTVRNAEGKIVMKTFNGVEYPQQKWINIRIQTGDLQPIKSIITEFEKML